MKPARENANAATLRAEAEAEELRAAGKALMKEVVRQTIVADRLREALLVAADDLGKAANQFDGMRESQRVGHTVPVVGNPEKFAEKAERARAAALTGTEPS